MVLDPIATVHTFGRSLDKLDTIGRGYEKLLRASAGAADELPTFVSGVHRAPIDIKSEDKFVVISSTDPFGPTQRMVLSREEIAKRLSPEDLEHLAALEASIDNRHAIWKAVYPQLALEVDVVKLAKLRAQLHEIVRDMRTDLEQILRFLTLLGIDPGPRYMARIRSLAEAS